MADPVDVATGTPARDAHRSQRLLVVGMCGAFTLWVFKADRGERVRDERFFDFAATSLRPGDMILVTFSFLTRAPDEGEGARVPPGGVLSVCENSRAAGVVVAPANAF